MANTRDSMHARAAQASNAGRSNSAKPPAQTVGDKRAASKARLAAAQERALKSPANMHVLTELAKR